MALAKTTCVESGQQFAPELIGLRRLIIAVVVDTQATTEIDVVDGNAGAFKHGNQIEHAVHGIQIRPLLRDLGADVAINAHHLQTRQCSRTLVGGQNPLVGNAEFIAFEAGRDVRVGFGVHIGVDADAHWRAFAHRDGDAVEHFQLGLALHIEAANADVQRPPHFCTCLAHT